MTYGVQHYFRQADWHFDSNPIFGWGPNDIAGLNAIELEPSINSVKAFGMRSNNTLYFFLGQMCAVSLVERIADFV